MRNFAFTIARLATTQPLLSLPHQQPSKLDNFISQPGLLAPRISVLTPAHDLPATCF